MDDCYEKKSCRICENADLIRILDLGDQPLANAFRLSASAPPDPVYPLRLMLCPRCFHLQLSHVVSPKVLYSTYQYVSGTSETVKRYFKDFAAKVDANNACKEKRVLDIACNDGSQLDAFAKLKWTTSGVDPATNVVQTADLKTHRIHNTFFSNEFATTFFGAGKVFDAIIAQNVFAHIDDVHDFLRGCKHLLAPLGKIYIQTSQALMVQHNEFDTIYHEHLSYFCIHSMKTLVESCGLFLVAVDFPEIHGTSFVFTITAEQPAQFVLDWLQYLLDNEAREGLHNVATYHTYANKVRDVCSDLIRCVANHVEKGHQVIGYGAAAKGNTLLNFTKLPLECVVDDSYIKIGKFTPGTNIPIVSIDNLAVRDIPEKDLVIVPLAWNFIEEIKRRMLVKVSNAKFVRYFPSLAVDTHTARPNRTCVIMHFFNEEYLLPYWLNHHKLMFDHGIMIDYHSTDKSAEIVKRIVPNWTLLTSRNSTFGITACDNEVMDIERTLARNYWKIALNVTEFLVIRDTPRSLMQYITNSIDYTYEAVSINTVIMIESRTDESARPVIPSQPLVKQRTYGDVNDRSRNIRVLHCQETGKYDFGRHNMKLEPFVAAPLDDIAVLWYGYSPFNNAVVDRKLQIQTKMIASEIDSGLGVEHRVTRNDLLKNWQSMQARTRDLRRDEHLFYITKYV